MNELEILGGEDGIVFRLRNTKEEIKARIVGPREIVGIPGEWVDAVIKVNSDLELLEKVIDHLQELGNIDRIIVKTSENKVIKLLNSKGFRHLGLNIYVKPVNPDLANYF